MATTVRPSPVTLAIHCSHCGGPVLLEFQPSDARFGVWQCPYEGCVRSVTVPGMLDVIRATKRAREAATTTAAST